MKAVSSQDALQEPRLLPLSGPVSAYALLDAGDFDRLSGWQWQLNRYGYAQRIVPAPENPCGQTTLSLHRAVLGLGIGDGQTIDHINRNRLDNRRVNLRLVDSSGNARNSRTEGDAVVFHGGRSLKKPWQAKPTINGKRRSLGYYTTREEAVAVVELARAEEFAHRGRERMSA